MHYLDISDIYDAINTNRHDLRHITALVSYANENYNHIADEHLYSILAVSADVLDSKVVLRNAAGWSKLNAEYYANLAQELPYFKKKFLSGSYDLDTIVDLCYILMNEVRYIRSQDLLKIIEVTLRDDVNIIDDSAFLLSGKTYAQKLAHIVEL